jgi:hypothetical protein
MWAVGLMLTLKFGLRVVQCGGDGTADPSRPGCQRLPRTVWIIGTNTQSTGPARTLVVYPTRTRGGPPTYGRVTSITLLPPTDPTGGS